MEELWEEAREEVGGLLPEDWRYDEQGYCYADRCIDWLSHSEYPHLSSTTCQLLSQLTHTFT